MTASHPRKSDRHTRCLSTGHGRARPDIRLSPQIVRQLTEFDATRRSSSSRFHHPPACWSASTPFTHLIRGTQIPIAQAAHTHVPLPRFPPLEVCGRRPPVHAAPPSWGRHPQTFRSGHSLRFTEGYRCDPIAFSGQPEGPSLISRTVAQHRETVREGVRCAARPPTLVSD